MPRDADHVASGASGRFTLRPAVEGDSAAIRDLVEAVDINPTGLHWPRFLVAVDSKDRIIGCGQIKPHAGGMLELASLAVRSEYRGQGIARALIERLLASAQRPVYLMCRSSLVPLYEAFGFQALPSAAMPRYFVRVRKLAGLAEYFAATGESLAVMKLG